MTSLDPVARTGDGAVPDHSLPPADGRTRSARSCGSWRIGSTIPPPVPTPPSPGCSTAWCRRRGIGSRRSTTSRAELSYQNFDQPFLDEIVRSAIDDAEHHLDALDADPDGPDRSAHVEALVHCPQPLKTRSVERFAGLVARRCGAPSSR